jgi:glucose-6-phosphate dehydrogenase assembly protein OpcA
VATPSEYRAILSGEPRPVDVAAVERELTELWKAAASDALEGHPVVRACVLNLVAYAPGEDVARHINEVIAQVSGRHPSRSIVIVAELDAEPSRLQASISAHCQIPPEGGKQVCSEQITLHALGAAVDEVHGTVLPLLVSDLPVFLWWHDEPALESHLFQELLDASDHLVIDSADFAPERAATALADLQRLSRESGVAFSDLNWARLSHWRQLVAQFFDAPPARAYLDRLSGVEIEIASTHGGEADLTEGLLMVGWLASRLRWTPQDGARRAGSGALAFTLGSAAGPVSVELSPDPDHPGEGLHAITLRAEGGAAFAISRSAGDEACVVAGAELPEGAAHSRVVHMEIPSEGALLCDELDMLGQDAAFQEALAYAVRFMNGEA